MFEDFHAPLSNYWTKTEIGGGSLDIVDSALRMSFAQAQQGRYSDAQIDDYGSLARTQFPWRPPLRMEVEARSSLPAATSADTKENNSLRGTAGFGFWNYPFSARGDILCCQKRSGSSMPRLPPIWLSSPAFRAGAGKPRWYTRCAPALFSPFLLWPPVPPWLS